MRPVLTLLLLLNSCARPPQSLPKPAPPKKIILWVWDRADDLRFLQPGEAEVAVLTATIYLRNGKAESWHRRLPLLLPEGLTATPVVRLESDGSPLPPPESVAYLLPFNQPFQIDFDVRESQLPWYRELLVLLRQRQVPISITSVMSACLDNPPLTGLANEIVPMLFRMGPQRNAYLAKLQTRGLFAEGCRDSLGLATDEPLPWRPAAKRIYVFNPNRWSRQSFDQIRSRLR